MHNDEEAAEPEKLERHVRTWKHTLLLHTGTRRAWRRPTKITTADCNTLFREALRGELMNSSISWSGPSNNNNWNSMQTWHRLLQEQQPAVSHTALRGTESSEWEEGKGEEKEKLKKGKTEEWGKSSMQAGSASNIRAIREQCYWAIIHLLCLVIIFPFYISSCWERLQGSNGEKKISDKILLGYGFQICVLGTPPRAHTNMGNYICSSVRAYLHLCVCVCEGGTHCFVLSSLQNQQILCVKSWLKPCTKQNTKPQITRYTLPGPGPVASRQPLTFIVDLLQDPSLDQLLSALPHRNLPFQSCKQEPEREANENDNHHLSPHSQRTHMVTDTAIY